MKHTFYAFAALCAAALLSLTLACCPMQASYKSTITPIYAATDSGLWIFNGSSWAQATSVPANSVVVSGSGAEASVFVGTGSGISYTSTNGASWKSWAGTNSSSGPGLGTTPVNKVILGTSILAATAGGVSIYNSDGSTNAWTNDASMTSVNDAFQSGTYTFVAGNLPASAPVISVINGTSTEATYLASTFLPTSTKVTAVVVDSYLDIFAGTDKGLVEINYTSGAVTYSANLLASSDYVYGLLFDSSGNLYAATSSGLYANVGTSSQKRLFSDTPALCVYVDGAGTIYAGIASGLRSLTAGASTWTTGLSGKQVNSVVTTAPLYSF